MKKIIDIVKRTFVYTMFFAILIVLVMPYIAKNIIYIKPYNDYVQEASDIYDIDENLIYSIMKVESKFKTNAKSNMDAIGLMQVMQPTADELVLEISDKTITSDLSNPRNNIYIATKYLAKLLKKYDNNISLATAAYNAGIGNVDKWIKEGIISKEDVFSLDNIPFEETRMYVKKVSRTYKVYGKLYE